MSVPWQHLPGPVRILATTVLDAVSAARSVDRDRFQETAVRLAALNAEQVGSLLGAVVRAQLEELHPDGLTGDDVRAVLEGCVRGAGWLPGVDPDVLVLLLTGALGVHQPEDGARRLTPPEVAWHAPLLLAELSARAPRPLASYLDEALREIARHETVEMP